jgi:hypothetical protein
MEWVQFAIFFLGVFGLWLWNRTEANADRRELHQMLREMKDEMKDFHSKLLVLEERYLELRERK